MDDIAGKFSDIFNVVLSDRIHCLKQQTEKNKSLDDIQRILIHDTRDKLQ